MRIAMTMVAGLAAFGIMSAPVMAAPPASAMKLSLANGARVGAVSKKKNSLAGLLLIVVVVAGTAAGVAGIVAVADSGSSSG